VCCHAGVSVTSRSLVQRRPKSTSIVEPRAKDICFWLFNDDTSTTEIKHLTLRYGTSPEVKQLTGKGKGTP
jgi:hypothetical protein